MNILICENLLHISDKIIQIHLFVEHFCLPYRMTDTTTHSSSIINEIYSEILCFQYRPDINMIQFTNLKTTPLLFTIFFLNLIHHADM